MTRLFIRVFRPHALYVLRYEVPARTPPTAQNEDTTVLVRVWNRADRIEAIKRNYWRYGRKRKHLALDAIISAVGGVRREWLSRLATGHPFEREGAEKKSLVGAVLVVGGLNGGCWVVRYNGFGLPELVLLARLVQIIRKERG